MIGRTLSHYKVLEGLSRGGIGIVYRALDMKLDREVAQNPHSQKQLSNPQTGGRGEDQNNVT